MVDQFIKPIPKKFLEDRETAEYFRDLAIFLDNMTREDGIIESGETTTETTETQTEQIAALDTATTANTATLDALLNSLPDYAISNDGTVRTLNADAALGVISATYVAAEIENIRDAVLALSDFVATMNRDLQNKDIFG